MMLTKHMVESQLHCLQLMYSNCMQGRKTPTTYAAEETHLKRMYELRSQIIMLFFVLNGNYQDRENTYGMVDAEEEFNQWEIMTIREMRS